MPIALGVAIAVPKLMSGGALAPPELAFPDFAVAYGHPLEATLAAKGKIWAYQDSARTTPVTSATQAIGSLTDFSTNDLHCSQATAGNRPIAIAGEGGFLSASFDGVNDFLDSGFFTPSAVFSAGGGGYTVLTVLSAAAESGGDRAYSLTDSFSVGADYSSQNMWPLGRNGSGNIAVDHGIGRANSCSAQAGPFPATGGVLAVRLNEGGGVCDIWAAGSFGTDNFTPATPINPVYKIFGAGMDGGVVFFGQFDIQKQIVWTNLKTDPQIAAMLAYERLAWSLP